MSFIVWTKFLNVKVGETLREIMREKEEMRRHGSGRFWWGMGTSLGEAVLQEANKAGGRLPVIFSASHSKPMSWDRTPNNVFLFTKWKDTFGITHKMPQWAFEIWHEEKCYALVCQSDEPLAVTNLRFDPSCYETRNGKTPPNQGTVLLRPTKVQRKPSARPYSKGFRANLVDPWFVRLTEPRQLSEKECNLLHSWRDYAQLLAHLRR